MRISLFHAVIIQLSGLLAASAGERFWKQDSAYAGSLACAKCHRAEHSLQERSHHARSLRPPTQVDELVKSLPFKFRDGASGAELALSQSASGGLELRATRQREMQRIDLEWAFGSGVKAITPLGRRAGWRFGRARRAHQAARRPPRARAGARGDPSARRASISSPRISVPARNCCRTESAFGLPFGVSAQKS